MSDPKRCEWCGGPLLLQSGVLEGRCPRCMVELGLESPSAFEESEIDSPALADKARSMVGRRLGHYEVLALVGAGGMGEVWKAKDTRLGREVAIKTLPEEFEGHADRLARFEREAKLLASLNHPNIAAIHGLDEDQGTRFLVLELVGGETLADRLRHGAIPLEESLKLARQIAEALEAAHEKGVIHRDLKPSNIKITNDGAVKVLDFGLAKAFVGDDVHADPDGSPAPNIDATEHGMILGTAGYMAPEQTRGRKVDRRADIWAFGVVLYEMVTGTRPFHGADSTETMGSVVTKEPDFDRVPASVQRLLRKCLEKDPKNRLRDIGDAWELLNHPFVTADAPPQVGRRDAVRWILASLLGIAAFLFSVGWLRPPPLPEVQQFQIHAPPGASLPLDTPAISHDGRTLAYTVADPDGKTRIHVRPIDRVETTALSGTEGAVHPFWSPRGDSLAFAAGPGLKRIDLASGSIRDLIGATGAPLQGAWNQNDDILLRAGRQLFRISAQGTTLRPDESGIGVGVDFYRDPLRPWLETTRPTPIPNSSGASFPAFLPDGQRFLVLDQTDNGNSIQLGALGLTERTVVVGDVFSAPILAPTPRGKTYLLFLRESDLMAQEFDQTLGKVLGKLVVLVPNVGRLGNDSVLPAVGVSPHGILAYQNADPATAARLRWVDRSGDAVRSFSPDVLVERPRLSPDGLVAGQRNGDIWVIDDRGSAEKKTFGASGGSPVWSKDGSRIAFRTMSGIYFIEANGSGKPQLLTDVPGVPTSWSRQHLLYTFPLIPRGRIYMLSTLDAADARKPLPVGSPYGYSSLGQFSPDGNYIAFASDRSGRDEIYVQPTPHGTGEKQVSINGGRVPRWKGDGTELFFVSPEGDLMAVDIKLGDVLSVGTPDKLFRFDSRDGYEVARNGYDVAGDGKQFLIISKSEGVNSPITVVLNWWVELEKRLGQ